VIGVDGGLYSFEHFCDVTSLPRFASNKMCEMEQKSFVEFSKMSLLREPSPPVSETQEVSGGKTCCWRARKMKQEHANPMEDSFEKARRAFFGDAKTSPEASASGSSDQREAAVSLVLAPRELAGLIGQRGGASPRRKRARVSDGSTLG
jgi:hypothetical protein